MTDPQLTISPLAELDIIEIGDFIRLDNPRRARSFIVEMHEFMLRVAARPFVGRARNDLRKGLRSVPFVGYPYTIYYRVLSHHRGIRIERVLHGARDTARLF